jgi:2-amino-4-hydroxy-6-hydroxymethyldihydropteridine diphosphokinase
VRMGEQLFALSGVQRRGRRGARPHERSHENSDEGHPETAQPRQHSRSMPTAYVGIGSNLGERLVTIRHALALLAADPELEVEAVSAIRETDPVGVLDQPLFLNAAVRLTTELPPRSLLEHLLAVEHQLGRVRTGERYGPRTIDLDLLLYGDEIVDEPGLSVPHPRLAERRFVLEPLAELDPGLVVPGLGPIQGLLSGLE